MRERGGGGRKGEEEERETVNRGSRIARPFMRAHSFSRAVRMCVSAHVNSPASSPRAPPPPLRGNEKRGCTEIALPCFARVYDPSPPPLPSLSHPPVLFPLHYLTWVTYTILWAAYLDGIRGGNVIRSCLRPTIFPTRTNARTLDQSQSIPRRVHRIPR